VGYTGSGFFQNSSYVGRSNLTWKYVGSDQSYRTPIVNAVTTWSNGTNVNLTEVPSGSSADITFDVKNFAATDPPGSAAASPSWELPFASCNIKYNVARASSLTATLRENLALHELGHCLSLEHRSVGVMRHLLLGDTTPNSADILLVNQRYP
jgi:predicted Zn-dependent protease